MKPGTLGQMAEPRGGPIRIRAEARSPELTPSAGGKHLIPIIRDTIKLKFIRRLLSAFKCIMRSHGCQELSPHERYVCAPPVCWKIYIPTVFIRDSGGTQALVIHARVGGLHAHSLGRGEGAAGSLRMRAKPSLLLTCSTITI